MPLNGTEGRWGVGTAKVSLGLDCFLYESSREIYCTLFAAAAEPLDIHLMYLL